MPSCRRWYQATFAARVDGDIDPYRVHKIRTA